MKRFEFSLDRLLVVKRQLERLAELAQQRAREEVELAQAKLNTLELQLGRVSDQMIASVGRIMIPNQWASATDLSERLGQSIKASQEEVAAAEQKLAATSQERAQIAVEVEGLSLLRQQQWDRWRQEAQRADQDRLDELVQRRWQAARDTEAAAPPRSP